MAEKLGRLLRRVYAQLRLLGVHVHSSDLERVPAVDEGVDGCGRVLAAEDRGWHMQPVLFAGGSGVRRRDRSDITHARRDSRRGRVDDVVAVHDHDLVGDRRRIRGVG